MPPPVLGHVHGGFQDPPQRRALNDHRTPRVSVEPEPPKRSRQFSPGLLLYPDQKLPKMCYWLIVNIQLHQVPKTVEPRWPSIIGPSLATSIRSATLAEIRWLTAEAKYVNAAWGTEIEVRVVAIPDDWRAPVTGDFKKETMESLSDLGRRVGADPSSWRVWVGGKSVRLTPAQ